MLEHEPLCFIEERGFWAASGYEDVNRILKDPVFVREYRNAVPQQLQQDPPPPPNEWIPVNDLLDLTSEPITRIKEVSILVEKKLTLTNKEDVCYGNIVLCNA